MYEWKHCTQCWICYCSLRFGQICEFVIRFYFFFVILSFRSFSLLFTADFCFWFCQLLVVQANTEFFPHCSSCTFYHFCDRREKKNTEPHRICAYKAQLKPIQTCVQLFLVCMLLFYFIFCLYCSPDAFFVLRFFLSFFLTFDKFSIQYSSGFD